MNNKITFKNVEDGLSCFQFEGNLLCVLTFRNSIKPVFTSVLHTRCWCDSDFSMFSGNSDSSKQENGRG